jgi:hypothetical protein
MNKINFKVIIPLVGIFFCCIFAAVIITQNNFFNNELTNKDPSKKVLNLGLNDVPQEPENLSAYQKFQEFWTDVYNQDANNWSYSDWRDYVILQIYNNTEDNLNNTIKDDPLFENNINVFTIYVMGKYNGSLSNEDITNLKSQLIHNTVHIGDISFLKHDDAQIRLFINIEVESSPSMWYIVDHLEIYLKSENSTGKWYNASGIHYVKVFDMPNLELDDPIYTDGKYENHIVGPIIINTNAIEENVSLVTKVEYFLNFLMEDYVEKLELFNLVDDDELSPEILYTYTGNYTDGNPGELIVNASDISGLSLDPSGTYQVPNTLGNHKFVFTASDADDDRLDDILNTTITIWINITDDDTVQPEISYIYTGDGTDGNPGELIVNASDISGLSLDPSGTYQVPNTLGNHTFTFTACDTDNDRTGDILNATIIVRINIIDDDDEGPIIKNVNITNNCVYDHYEFIIIDVLAEDKSGISELFIVFNDIWYYDDSGDCQFLIENPRTPGIYNFFIVVIDADNDREGDHKTTQIISSFEVFDDDITPPNIHLYYDNYNYQISILDNDGIIDSKATGEYHLINEEGMILESGIMSLEDFKYLITIPLKSGNYTLEVFSTNNDIEWEGDEEINVAIFDISVGIKACFQNVNDLLEKLIIYVDANLYSILADNIRYKLRLAQEDLWDACDLVDNGNLKCCLFNEIIVQAIIEFVEFETEIYNKIDLINDDIRNEIITSLHEIRNFVILLIGTSVDYVLGLTGISSGYNIALIEVELLNLADLVEEELGSFGTKYLEKLIRLSALHLELAIIKLSRGINPDSTLSSAQRFIERAKEEVNKLLENYEITEGITVCSLLETLDYCYSKIDEIIMEE